MRSAEARFSASIIRSSSNRWRSTGVEVGWTTNYVSQAIQAANLHTGYNQFAATGYVAVPFWFQLRDIAAANLYYGLLTPFDPPWTRKLAWNAFHQYRLYCPLILTAPGETPG